MSVGGGMGGRYTLKCGDRALLTFEFAEDEFGTPEARVLESDPSSAALMPWGLEADGEYLYRWLSVRALPHNRRYASEFCRAMGFSIDDVPAVFRALHARPHLRS